MIKKVKPLQLIIFITSALVSVFFFVLFFRAALSNEKDLTKWIIIAFYVLMFIWVSIPTYLSITYILEDWNKTIKFDEENQILTIIKRKKVTTINRNEIIAAYEVKVDRYKTSSFSYSWYKYALIMRKERERIFITNLICNPEEVLSFFKIQYKSIFWNIPVISRNIGSEFLTTDEFNKLVVEFEEEFQNYSKEQLQNVLRNPQTYTDYARRAASNLLDKL
jgi:hypothetical protein